MIEFNYYEDIPTNFTGVCKVTIIGNIYHVKNGEIHNENGPAVIYSDGSKRWYINNLEHREDGPSAEHSNGQKDWLYKNTCYGENEDFTIETWIEKVEQLKRKEEFEIFK